MTKFELAELTSDQKQKWAATRSALVWHCPAFSHVFYSMMDSKGADGLIAMFITTESGEAFGIPTAATDGRNIIIVPERFFSYSLAERIFIVAHEIMHGIFGHVELIHKFSLTGKVPYPDGKVLDFDPDTMNKAMDYVINDMLIQSKVGNYNPNWLHDRTIATGNDSVLTAYRRIYQQNQNGGGGGGGGSGGGGGQQSFDKHMKPGQGNGQDPTAAAQGRNEMEWKTAVAGAIATAKAQGKLPAGLERAFSEYLEPTVDWTDMVQGFFSRKIGAGTWDWQKPDRRLVTRGIISPGRAGFGCGTIVCGIDTSGSVGQKEIDLFFGNLAGIFEDLRPREIVVMFCDAKVHRVDEVEDVSDLYHLKTKGVPGGGGTSFIPVFDEISKRGIEPDALIYLTDGYGTFPKNPPAFPVLWGAIAPDVSYPFGDVVEVPPVK